MSEITFILDGAEVRAEPGTTILTAALDRGIFIPTLCHHQQLKPFASCFICVVELEGRPNLVPACSTLATEGIVVHSASAKVEASRRTCIELLLSDHLGDCQGPCMAACPAGIDIPGFLKYIASGEDRKALELIKRNMPLPGVLARVCPRPCETACRRSLVDEPIAICQLKRLPADSVAASGDEYIPETDPPTGKRVAIIGSGPAGLTTAYYLQIMGHQCTVFEAHSAAGGMIRYGIPSYRLPREVIDQEVAVIEKMGVHFRFNTRVGDDLTLDQVRRDYDAVFLALGAQRAGWLGIPGEALEGVFHGIGFLGKISRDEKTSIGKRILVVGGGNVALDSARSAVRLGAEVTIVYRRTEEEMPCWEEEVSAAREEGIGIEFLKTPTRIDEAPDGGLQVTFVSMELGEPDETGRRRPAPVPGSEQVRRVDNLIVAIGQRVDIRSAEGVEQSVFGTIMADEDNLLTNLPGVFSGGDCVLGPDIVVNLIGMGRRAAVAIDQYLSGNPVAGEPALYNQSMGSLEQVPEVLILGIEPKPRVKPSHLAPETRRHSFVEVEAGFTPEQAREEASRCQECGCRAAADCRLREYASRYGAQPERLAGACREFDRDLSHPEIVYDAHKCIQCGICVRLGEEVLGASPLGFVGRGFASRVKPALDRPLGEVGLKGLKQIVESCPVGAFTYKGDPVHCLDSVFRRPDATGPTLCQLPDQKSEEDQ